MAIRGVGSEGGGGHGENEGKDNEKDGFHECENGKGEAGVNDSKRGGHQANLIWTIFCFWLKCDHDRKLQ
jgi:hypothetical protein